MNMQKRKPSGASLWATTVLFFFFMAGALDMGGKYASDRMVAYCAVSFLGMIAVALLLMRLTGLMRLAEKWTRGFGSRRSLAVLFLAAVLLRGLRILFRAPEIGSDYALYTRLAEEYARTGTVPVDEYIVRIAPNVPLYAVLLGLAMKIFGAGPATAQGLCLVLHTVNVFLLFAAGKKLTSPRRAFFAAAVFAVLPENVMYAALPGIEAPSMTTILAGMILVLGAEGRPAGRRILRYMAGGAVLAFSACLRPSAVAVIAALAVWMIRSMGRKSIRRLAAGLLAAALGIGGVLAGNRAFRNAVFPGEKPAGMLGWTLFEGLDLENGGYWTEEKSARCIEVIFSSTPEESDRIFMQEALERFHGYTFPEKIRMFARKGGLTWYMSSYAAYGSGQLYYRFAEIATVSWLICLAAWIACLLRRGGQPGSRVERRGWSLCLQVILMTVAWHMIGTSIDRYHYMMIPFILLMTAMMIPGKEEAPDGTHGENA